MNFRKILLSVILLTANPLSPSISENHRNVLMPHVSSFSPTASYDSRGIGPHPMVILAGKLLDEVSLCQGEIISLSFFAA